MNGENRADADVDINIARAVERVEGDSVLAGNVRVFTPTEVSSSSDAIMATLPERAGFR